MKDTNRSKFIRRWQSKRGQAQRAELIEQMQAKQRSLSPSATMIVNSDGDVLENNIDIPDVDSPGMDLRGIDLSSVSLDGADLSRAQLQGSNLARTSLKGAILVGADLRDAFLRNTDFTGADLRNVHLGGAILENTCFTKTNLAGAIVTEKTAVVNLEMPDLFSGAERSPWFADDLSQYMLNAEEEG